MSGVWQGLTWDHPRGYRALEAAARDAGESGLTLSWDRRPLEGFEGRVLRLALEQAALPPRHAGAIAFQTAAAERQRRGLFDEHPADAVLDDLQILHDRHHVPGAEI